MQGLRMVESFCKQFRFVAGQFQHQLKSVLKNIKSKEVKLEIQKKKKLKIH